MEEIGAPVASPMFMPQGFSVGFPEQHAIAKKRSLAQSFQYQQQCKASKYWNPNSWEWNSVDFVAKPLETNGLPTQSEHQIENERLNGVVSAEWKGNLSPVVEDDESLKLQLGGGLNFSEEPALRPSKKVRSGSPGGGGRSYPMCQVDDCREDLLNAKDYHRRHKVCQVHSKASKALVGKQMQRFCQQCSRLGIKSHSSSYGCFDVCVACS